MLFAEAGARASTRTRPERLPWEYQKSTIVALASRLVYPSHAQSRGSEGAAGRRVGARSPRTRRMHNQETAGC